MSPTISIMSNVVMRKVVMTTVVMTNAVASEIQEGEEEQEGRIRCMLGKLPGRKCYRND